MPIAFTAMPTDRARALQQGGADDYGQQPLRRLSDGDGMPCRHCLSNIADGDEYLILAFRPFSNVNPFAETGPIFLHADECERAGESAELPVILDSPDYIVRGYNAEQQIVYGTGAVTPTGEIRTYAQRLLENDEIAFVDIRSARNNCFQCRVVRA